MQHRRAPGARPLATVAALALPFLPAIVAAQESGATRPPPVVLRVPFAAGERQTVWRGPGVGSHADVFNRHAVDFSPIAVGHPILSSSAGRVVWVKEDTDGPTGLWTDNNEVAVLMPNGKDVVVYLHLQRDGAVVDVDDEVLPGDLIGHAGNTGSSDAPHLHIDVRKGHRLGPSIPWRFDVLDPGEEPRAGQSIRSNNVPARGPLAPWLTLERLLALALELDATSELAGGYRELMSGEGPPAARGPRADPMLREPWESVRDRLEAQWLAAAQDAADDLERAAGEAERAAAALRIIRTFAGTEHAASADAALSAIDPAIIKAAERDATRRARTRSRLKTAFEMELEFATGRGASLPPAKRVARLEAAYKRATSGLGDERADIVRRHMKSLADPGGG